MEDIMPRETVYGGELFVLDRKTGNEWPLLDTPDEARGEPVCQRGVDVHWGRDCDSVEIGVTMLETATGEHVDLCNDPVSGRSTTGAYTHLDQPSLVRLIRTLKRAGRQSFGDVPW